VLAIITIAFLFDPDPFSPRPESDFASGEKIKKTSAKVKGFCDSPASPDLQPGTGGIEKAGDIKRQIDNL